MDKAAEAIASKRLAFFGSVNASISHELKNVLAIISETVGLLDDLQQIAQNKGAVAPETLANCTRSIGEEVRRGFEIIRRMNQFAHSIDAPVAKTDIVETVEQAVALSQLLSYASQVGITAPRDDELSATTSPFLLLELLYRTMVFAYRHQGPAGKIDVAVQATEGHGTEIILSNVSSGADASFPDDVVREIASAIEAQIQSTNSDGTLTIGITDLQSNPQS
jgi:light-regulated signal transduction histidine kinase (bacteriophytochrome)